MPVACLLVGLLAAWTGLAVVLGLRFFGRLDTWTTRRLDLTHKLIERMVGHRTILAQERAAHRTEAGRDMSSYLAASIGVDRAVLPFVAAIPAGWLVLAIAGLLLVVLPGAPDAASLAVGVGGVLFAARALGSVTSSLAALGRAAIAWREIAPMFKAAAEPNPPTPFLAPSALREETTAPPCPWSRRPGCHSTMAPARC